VASFRKDLVFKSFKATGIWPMERAVVTKRFSKRATSDDDDDDDDDDSSTKAPSTRKS
jgi:hypothetical protein